MKKMRSSFAKKVSILMVVALLSMCASGCGENEPSSVQSAKVPTEALSTEKREQVDVEDPNKPIEGGGDVSIEPTSETTEEVTSTEEVTETTETETTAPSGAYTYTVYGDITLTMDVNIDDYIRDNGRGKEFFHFWQLASDLGWLARGEYKATQDMSLAERGASFWMYSDGKCRTMLEFAEENPADAKVGPINYITVSFRKLDSLDKYYDDSSIDHKTAHIQYAQRSYANVDHYDIAGYNISVSRDDVVVLAYTLWFMKDHCGEALEFCQSFGPHYIQSDVATFNNINLP